MVPLKAAIVFVPIAVAGAWAVVDATREIDGLKEELAREEETGRSEGASFVETLQGSHAEKQFKAFDRRREIALQLTRQRRNRFIGLFALAFAGLGLATATVLRRIAAELEEDRRYIQDGNPPR
jgi:hypothetical protein